MKTVFPTRPPLLSLLGVAIAVGGVVVDLVVHLTAGPVHDHGGFSPSEHGAHLIVVAGMLLGLAGVVVDGARSQLRAAVVSRASARRTSKRATSERTSGHAVR